MYLTISSTCNFVNCVAPTAGEYGISNENITITAKSGFKMLNNPELGNRMRIAVEDDYGDIVDIYPKLSTDEKSVYYDKNDYMYSSTGILYGDYFTEEEVITYHSRLILSGTLTNCHVEIDGQTINEADFPIVRSTYFDFSVVANDGYEFTGSNYTFSTDVGNQFYEKINNTKLNGFVLEPETYSDSETRITNITATQIPITTLSPLITIYSPTEEEISQLSNAGFFNVVDGYRISDYMTRYYSLPFDISDILSENKSNIKLGKLDTQVPSYTVLKWNTNINGGTITITPKYNNVYDYINITALIKTPFFDVITTNDVSLIMNAVLSFEYLIELYTGYATLKIMSSLSNVPIFTQTKKVSYDLPFIQIANISYLDNLNIPMIEDMFQASVVIKRDKPIMANEPFGKQTTKITELINEPLLSGFVIISEIQLSDTIPQEIQNEIMSLLGRGIFI